MPNGTQKTGWVGWVYFAGVLLILRGISEAFLGITGLVNKHYLFVTGANVNSSLVVSTANINAWSWVDLAVGLLILAVGFSVLHGSTWARIIAVFFAGLSFLVNIAFIGVFPVWAIVAALVDVLVIYALVVHGDEVA